MPTFARTIGIDYSGAETATASLRGLRVCLAERDAHPVEEAGLKRAVSPQLSAVLFNDRLLRTEGVARIISAW